MRSTFHLLEVAKRGIVAQQNAINTTGQNISNVNTPGYSRQRVNMEASRPIDAPAFNRSTAPGQIGMGVEVTSITRVRDTFLDAQYRNQNNLLAQSTIVRETLGNIEGIVNEPSDSGISKSLSEFWNAWQVLSKNPGNTDIASRSAVQQKAIALAESFNHVSTQLNSLKDDLTNKINVGISQANNYIGQISSLTQEIKRVEAMGDNANDLRDKRDLLVDQLSTLGNVKVTEGPNDYQVTFGNKLVVDNMNSSTISLTDVPNIKGGQLEGYVDSRDTYVAEYTKQLDIMANTLATGKVEVTLPAGTILPPGVTIPGAVTDPTNPRKLMNDTKYTVDGLNGLHKLGYTLEDPATTGLDFFTTSDGSGTITAGNIQLNPALASDLKKFAASMRTETVTTTTPPITTSEKVIQGNGDLALLIAGLAEKSFNFNPTGTNGALSATSTYEGYFQAVVSQLGAQSDYAQKKEANDQLLTDHAESLRQAVSSVSLDEESADLIKFQHAYSASARVITAMDEMLDKLINGTGVVGR